MQSLLKEAVLALIAPVLLSFVLLGSKSVLTLIVAAAGNLGGGEIFSEENRRDYR